MYASCSYWPNGGAVVHFRADTGERDSSAGTRRAKGEEDGRERLADSGMRTGEAEERWEEEVGGSEAERGRYEVPAN